MKKILLLFSVFTTSFLFCQETEFKMTPDGFTDFIVVQKDGKTAHELYTKTLEWINRTYKNPDKVILGKVQDDYIRFEGSKDPLVCKKILLSNICETGRYQIEVSIKDGKYKFDLISLETYMAPTQSLSGGWFPVNINKDTAYYFKKDGSPKAMFKEYSTVIPDYFNSLSKSLSDYISGTGIEGKKADW